jgi:group I intron endonuclease
MTQGIYKIINVVTNDFYVGSSNKFAVRKREHWRQLRNNKHHNKHLQNSWNKYGESSFIFVIVENLPIGKDIHAAENVWLKEHVGKPYCYNISIDAFAPATGCFGDKNPMWGKTFSHTEEAKKRISAASKLQVQSEETKAKRIRTMQGHQVTAEVRAKISATLSGAGNPNFGKPRSKEFVDKVRKEVYEISTDTYYPSVKKAREKLNLKPTTITRALKSGKPISNGPNKGLQFKYVPTPYQCAKNQIK